MRAVWLIAARELRAWLRGPTAYVIAAIVLAITGLLFNVFALGGPARPSSEIIRKFFFFSAGTTMIAAILLGMRTLAEERRDGTDVLLRTAPVGEGTVVLAKWAAAWVLLCGVLALSAYLPLLVAVRGSVPVAHVVVGYVGLALMGGAVCAVGTAASSLTRSQLLAGVVGGGVLAALLSTWRLARVVHPPFDEVFAYAAFFDAHFAPFSRGEFPVSSTVYFASVTAVALVGARAALVARRWG